MLEGLEKPIFNQLGRNSKFEKSPRIGDMKKEINGEENNFILSQSVNHQPRSQLGHLPLTTKG